jgi:hypothetical protein
VWVSGETVEVRDNGNRSGGRGEQNYKLFLEFLQ